MSHFPFSFSRKHQSGEIVAECLETLGAGHDPDRTLGFLYATDALGAELGGILAGLKTTTGVRHWVGSLGSGIVTSGAEHYSEPACAAMLAPLEKQAFSVIPPITGDVDAYLDSSRAWLEISPIHFGILHGDPTNPTTPQLIENLSAGTPGAFFVGGLTSSSGPSLQIADQVTEGGISGVMFSHLARVVTGHTQGCSPIGPKRRITRCQRNVLVELDGRPALDVFREDIGELLAKDLNRVAGYIFVGLPVAGSDTGDYLVRNLIAIDVQRKLIAIGDRVSEGQELMICRRDSNTAREDLSRMLEQLTRRLDSPPRGALYFSCLGRGQNQFGTDSEELKIVAQALGDVPLTGFFANGEIFSNRLYGYTGVLSLFL